MLGSAAGKVVWMGRAVVVCVGLAVALGLLAPPAHALDTFTVDSVADTGDDAPEGVCEACTLREAIQEANDNDNPAEVDRIEFDISGTGVHTISPASALPAITEPAIIDGYSQPGTSPNTRTVGEDAVLKVVLDGIGVSGNGLQISGVSDSVIRGLVIRRFGLAGIAVSGTSAGNRIEGNFIGTNRYGTSAPGNEGKKFIGECSSVANSGPRSFTYSPEMAVSVGQTITATAAGEFNGDTSEFSAPQTVGSS